MDILTIAVKQIKKLQINGRKLQVNASLNVIKKLQKRHVPINYSH